MWQKLKSHSRIGEASECSSGFGGFNELYDGSDTGRREDDTTECSELREELRNLVSCRRSRKILDENLGLAPRCCRLKTKEFDWCINFRIFMFSRKQQRFQKMPNWKRNDTLQYKIIIAVTVATLLNMSSTTPFCTRNSRVSMTICVSPKAMRTPKLSLEDWNKLKIIVVTLL